MEKNTVMCSAFKLGKQPRKERTILALVWFPKRTFRLRILTLVAMALGLAFIPAWNEPKLTNKQKPNI